MALGSPSASLANRLVFWSPDTYETSHAENGTSPEGEDSLSGESDGSRDGGVSMYVQLFADMLKEVLDHEGKLFVESELDLFMKYHRLPYPAKYLFCRLCLRKTDKWHRLSSLKYESELGDGIIAVVKTLCGRPQPPVSSGEQEDVKPLLEEQSFINPDLEPTFRLPDPQIKSETDVEPDSRAAADVPTVNLRAEVDEDVKPVLNTSPAKGTNYPIITIDDREVIDLTFDGDDDGDGDETEVEEEIADEKRLEVGPSTSRVYEPSTPSLTPRSPDFSVFADDEEQVSLFELLDCLTTDELHDIAKQLKLKTKVKRRDHLIDSILRSSSTQGTLAFPVVGTRKGKEKAMVQSKLPFGAKNKSLMQTVLPFKPREPYRTQQDRVRDIVMTKLQKCIRLNADVVALFRRANLVYFRSTQHTSELLTPALLARAKKRAYPTYPYARTPDIWRTRAELLAYEDALAVEAEVDALLENTTSAWGRGRDGSTMSRTPGLSMGRPSRTPMTPATGACSVSTPGKKGVAIVAEEEAESVRVKNARMVKEILECIYPRWETLVAEKRDVEDEDGWRKALQRFECGHILTRVVCKGAHALGILREYDRELQVLDALLAQTRWRRGRRGRWHDRRALLLMNHLRPSSTSSTSPSSSPSPSPTSITSRVADHDASTLRGVVAALEDPDTHIVFRPMLERRLTRLEKWLDIPADERHECAGRLRKAAEVYVKGVRVDRRLMLDEAGRVVDKGNGSLSWANRRDTSPQKRLEEVKQEKGGGKSIWKGRDGDEVSVEELALQHYEDIHGCKGFHSEGRIVTTLFGLLFWDVIFAPLPGAFETRYQAAPLDLAEDTFYYARQAIADARIAEIEAGRAAEILEETWRAHEGVVCVGVRWDMFAKDDLVGIVKCMDPKALAVICRLMCEDYAGRTGGVPDLIVWNEEEGWAKFVEVKGPGDSLQENQKVWIDVLLQAGMPVEVCHVYEAGSTPKKAKPKPKPPKASAQKTPGKRKAGGGRKRKRGARDDGSEPDDFELVIESEEGGEEENVDYSQLDRGTDEEVEDELEPVKKKRRKTLRAEPESPVARKVARLNSQAEVLNATPEARRTRSRSRAR
ncbi:hypothetical protein BN946_scf185014.g40 [Trametes cinnabarina]|uniref:Fanconi-associated nuclease n=1 Tax=Pycnoporus cinnabarinus TaxID=5643 RepID=A0A060SGP0_PYCCI|nr:hypothetical protein BN946_scf185014.g40 [Trametes cinnabarina]